MTVVVDLAARRASSPVSDVTACSQCGGQWFELRRVTPDGVEATKAMIATTGKARSLGERSIGHPDPGAISVSLILKAAQDYVATA